MALRYIIRYGLILAILIVIVGVLILIGYGDIQGGGAYKLTRRDAHGNFVEIGEAQATMITLTEQEVQQLLKILEDAKDSNTVIRDNLGESGFCDMEDEAIDAMVALIQEKMHV